MLYAESDQMNIRDLKYLIAVADLRNFSKAADKCYVSQPTLSGQIKKVEEWLGVKIFERTNKRVMPTEVGTAIIDVARRILKDVEQIEEMAQNAQDPLAGTFKLGAFPTLATYVFPELAPKISKKMENLKLILIEEKTEVLLAKLRDGSLDAALLALPIVDDFLESTELFSDEFYLATSSSHALAKRKYIEPQELAEHKLLLLEEGHCLRDQALEVCQLHHIGEEQDFRATGLETLRQMVKVGTGITLMPKVAIQKDRSMKFIPFKPTLERKIGLVWRKTTTRKPVIEKIASFF